MRLFLETHRIAFGLLSVCVLVCHVHTAALGAGGWVLCQGEDGHYAVESKDAECCDPPVTTDLSRTDAAVASLDWSDDARHCGACTDAPLLLGSGVPAAFTRDHSNATPIAIPVWTLLQPYAAIPVADGLTPSSSPPIRSCIESVRSVVLLA